MSRFSSLAVLLALLALLGAPPLRAQGYQASGPQATELFQLEPGLVVFEMQHSGAGRFRVRLLDERGEQVEELADAQGPFEGSRAVRVPRSGRYLLDVTAGGPWSVRRRDAGGAPEAAFDPGSPEALRGQEAGIAAAAGVPAGGWFVRGLVGGVLAGPLGAAIAVGMAGGSRVAVPAEGASASDPLYRDGFGEGFTARVRDRRRKLAFVGGMAGSAAFVAGLIFLVDVAAGGGGGAVETPGGAGPLTVRVPR